MLVRKLSNINSQPMVPAAGMGTRRDASRREPSAATRIEAGGEETVLNEAEPNIKAASNQA